VTGQHGRHVPPFFCPYCGDESLRPHGEAHGEWVCESCRRAFALRAVRPAAEPGPASGSAERAEAAR
jgi:ribosomal protein L37AE/L43A